MGMGKSLTDILVNNDGYIKKTNILWFEMYHFRFDPHKLVVSEIAHLIRSHLEEGKPSWKQLSGTQRNAFFDLFQVINVGIC